MRARYLKPDVFLDEELAEVPIPARYLYLGLMCAADREGRLEDRPRRIKGQIYVYDDLDAEEMLARLADAKLITRYTVDGRKYIEIPAFKRDQRPHSNESASVIPEPDVATSHHGEQDLSPRKEALRSENGELDSENGERSEEGETSRAVARPSPNGYTPEQLAEDWNVTAERTRLRRCRELTPERIRTAKKRLRDCPKRDFWLGVIQRLGESAFCCGNNDRGWIAGFDFLLRPETPTSTLEGKYDDHIAPQDTKAAKNLGAARRFLGEKVSS
jgi:hypothetical protein